jgi:hypothetical protein
MFVVVKFLSNYDHDIRQFCIWASLGVNKQSQKGPSSPKKQLKLKLHLLEDSNPQDWNLPILRCVTSAI